MSMEAANETATSTRGNLAQWIALLGPPTLWIVQMQINYALVLWVCKTGHLMVLHLCTLVFLLLSIGCGLLALRDWRRVGMKWPRGIEGDPLNRTRFMSAVSVMGCALFSLVILAQGIAPFIIGPCEF